MREALRGWEDEAMREVIETKCIHYAQPLLKKLPPVSWFVSRDKGGLGLPTSRPTGAIIGEHHLRLAAWFSSWNHTHGRDERVRHQWRLQPGPFFSEIALSARNAAADAVGAGWIRVDRGVGSVDDRDPLLSRILRGYAPLGVDFLPSDDRTFLKDWYRSYWKWVKSAEGAAAFLKPMDAQKATREFDWVWDREAVVVS